MIVYDNDSDNISMFPWKHMSCPKAQPLKTEHLPLSSECLSAILMVVK